MSEIVPVPFHNGEVLSVAIDGKPHVILRPALERLGVDFDSQRKKLDGKSWACKVLITAQLPGSPQRREVLAVDVRTFLMLLATIDEKRVGADARPLLVAYQCEVADAIEAYWTKGNAVNPRCGEAESYAPRTLTLDETCALLEQRYGLSYSVVGLARALRTCGVLKQNGAPRREFRWWFWFTGSTWNVHPHVVVAMARRLDNAEEQLRAFDGIQLRLEAEGVGGQQELAPP